MTAEILRTLDAVRERCEKAHREICGLADGTRKWRMSIPVRADDSDCVLQDALDDVGRLVAMVEAARAGLIAVAGPQRGEYVDRNAREALAELDRLAAGGTQ